MSKSKYNDQQATYQDLYDKLKSMRFSGMAEELRLQQADPNQDAYDFIDRLSKFVNAEWDLRYNKKFMRMLRQSHIIITEASFDESLYDPERQLDRTLIETICRCDWIETGKNLLLTGMTGTGKSYFASALGIAVLKKLRTVRYCKASKLLTELTALRQSEEYRKLTQTMETLSKIELLIIDDFGLMDLDIEKCRYLFEILDSREGRLSTIVVSQIPVKDWYDLFHDHTYADACLDRLVYNAYRIEFKGESLRKKTP